MATPSATLNPADSLHKVALIASVASVISLSAVMAPSEAAAAVTFKLPYPAGASYQVTASPNEGCPANHHRCPEYLPEYNQHAVDFGMPVGSKVAASASGSVYFAGDTSSGKQVRIIHEAGSNQCTQYAHLNSITVSQGAGVTGGQVIGTSGTYGSGPHLHWNLVDCASGKSLGIVNTAEVGTTYTRGRSLTSQNGAAAPPPAAGTSNGGGRIRGVGSGRCLDVVGMSVQPGAGVQLYDCNDTPNQLWSAGSNGQLRVYGNYSMCLDADANTQGANGTRVQIYTCHAGANQQWTAQADGTLRSVAYGRCLDAVGVGTANGTPMQLWDCRPGATNQQWVGIATPNGGGRIQGVGSNRCLDVEGASISPAANIQIWDCSGAAQQQWRTDGSQIKVFGDKCLDVEGAQTGNGARVQTWYCSGAVQQQWTWNSDGTIQSNLNGKCLDVAAVGTSNGSRLQMFDCLAGATNQQWRR